MSDDVQLWATLVGASGYGGPGAGGQAGQGRAIKRFYLETIDGPHANHSF